LRFATHPSLTVPLERYSNFPRVFQQTASWSEEELEKRGSKELQGDLTDQKWNFFLSRVKLLGKFQMYEGCKGQAYMSQVNLSPEIVTAEYTASASFQNGTAEIQVKLIQKNGQWQILKFTVDSPIFYK